MSRRRLSAGVLLTERRVVWLMTNVVAISLLIVLLSANVTVADDGAVSDRVIIDAGEGQGSCSANLQRGELHNKEQGEAEGQGDCGCSGSLARDSFSAIDDMKGSQKAQPPNSRTFDYDYDDDDDGDDDDDNNKKEDDDEEDDDEEGVSSRPAVGATMDDEGDKNMIYMRGGTVRIGTDDPQIVLDGEAPSIKVTIDPYYLDKYSVSNADYAAFVKEVHYVTDSEKYGWSFVFQNMLTEEQKDQIDQAVQGTPWWLPVQGAFWRYPEGRTSVIHDGRGNHPAVHISWADARAYCVWRGARLPTEVEYEVAAAGGVYGRLYPWGNELLADGEKHRMNIWQGRFPSKNSADDGYESIAPVDAYGPQNAFGFHNLIGNVWEWVEDWWTVDRSTYEQKHNPKGPSVGTEKTKKGGSFLCHKSYCYRYRVAARTKSDVETGTSNQGFRCARTATLEEQQQQQQ